MVSAKNASFEPVVGLEREAGQIGDVAAQRADPALLGHHDGDRLALDQRLLDRRLVMRRAPRRKWCGACRAASSARMSSRTSRISPAIGLPLLLLGAQQLLDRLLLGAQRLVLLADLHFLEPAQIAQPHVEDGVGLHVGELERLHQHRLRLVLVADDLDDLVEVEIGDEIAAEHFEPVLDLRRAGSASGAAARRGGASSHSLSASARPTTFGTRPSTSTFMLSGTRLSSSVSLNRLSIISAGSTVRERGSNTRRTSSANSSRMSATQRQLLLVDQLGDAARPAAIFCTCQGISVTTI